MWNGGDASSLLFLQSLYESQNGHPQKWHDAVPNDLVIRSTPLIKMILDGYSGAPLQDSAAIYEC